MGVRTSPKFMIPFEGILFLGLHTSIGIGSVFVNKLEKFIDIDMEHISPEEFQQHETKSSASIQIELLWAKKKQWNQSANRGWLLIKKRTRSKNLAHELIQADDSARQEEKNILDRKILTLEAAWNVFSKQIVGLNADITKVSEKLEMFTKDRRIGEVSVYTQIGRIFQSHGANRSYYFGCQFQGKDVCKIMDKADKLFGSNGTGGEMRTAFVSHETAKGLVEAEKEKLLNKVNKKCANVQIGLKLWDSVLAGIHLKDPDDDHCNKTQDQIDKAMAHTQRMGISFTQKCMVWKCML
jgi:hypothetical protein